MRRLALLIVMFATPALAEDAPVLEQDVIAAPGAVALYLQGLGLAELGQRHKDPLLVLAAARLMHGLSLRDTPRRPDGADEAASDPALAPALAAVRMTVPDAVALLTVARGLDVGDNYADLTDMLAREVPPQPHVLRASASTLAPGASETWTLPFYGGTHAELAVVGDGSSNLDLLVLSADQTQICQDGGSADRAYCGFVLRENGDVTITVSNAGAAPGNYLLLTE